MPRNKSARDVMSVVTQNKSFHIRCSMTQSTFDRILGFLQGALATGLIGLIVGAAFVELDQITLWTVIIVVSAMLTLLLLRGVPVNKIRIGENKFMIDFEIRRNDDEE